MQEFSKGSAGNTLVFPFTQQSINSLTPSSLASPRVGAMHGVQLPTEFSDLQPWAEEIERVRSEVSRDEFPRWFMDKYFPATWGVFPDSIPGPLKDERLSFYNPKGLANVVHMDNPLDLGKAIHAWLLRNNYRPILSTTTGHVEFLDNVCEAMRIMTNYVTDALDKSFAVKYYYGVARPEEVLSYNMTYYSEGCPTHPSFPAGHGAAAGGTAKYFLDYFDLDSDAIFVVRTSAYIWAMARSLAGVHYAQDNLAGLWVGGLNDVTYRGFTI